MKEPRKVAALRQESMLAKSTHNVGSWSLRQFSSHSVLDLNIFSLAAQFPQERVNVKHGSLCPKKGYGYPPRSHTRAPH